MVAMVTDVAGVVWNKIWSLAHSQRVVFLRAKPFAAVYCPFQFQSKVVWQKIMIINLLANFLMTVPCDECE